MHGFFFFNDTATTEIYTLSLHDALPILPRMVVRCSLGSVVVIRSVAMSISRKKSARRAVSLFSRMRAASGMRSEEHTSELQSRQYLVCRLLLEKKKHDESSINPWNVIGC